MLNQNVRPKFRWAFAGYGLLPQTGFSVEAVTLEPWYDDTNDQPGFDFRPNPSPRSGEATHTMRISGGDARGIPLVVPRGDAVRPATDGMRQAVFSSLGTRVAGACFLDLFAGSGAYGLEALSRGASSGTFVERNPKAVACLRQNISSVCKSLRRNEAEVAVIAGDVLRFEPSETKSVDLVFVDPPYEIISEVSSSLFEKFSRVFPAVRSPVVVFEMPGELDLTPSGWECVKRLGKGARQPTVCFFRRTQQA
jgi:16S rRNA (guanine966-N2)-methyltransferase